MEKGSKTIHDIWANKTLCYLFNKVIFRLPESWGELI